MPGTRAWKHRQKADGLGNLLNPQGPLQRKNMKQSLPAQRWLQLGTYAGARGWLGESSAPWQAKDDYVGGTLKADREAPLWVETLRNVWTASQRAGIWPCAWYASAWYGNAPSPGDAGRNGSLYVSRDGGSNLTAPFVAAPMAERLASLSAGTPEDNRGTFVGINVPGGESGSLNTGHPLSDLGYGSQWAYPSLSDMQFLRGRGMRYLRIPMYRQRLQPTKSAAFDAGLQTRLTTFLNNAQTARVKIILDLHNFGTWSEWTGAAYTGCVCGTTTGSVTYSYQDYADFYYRLAQYLVAGGYLNNPVIGIDLENEPNTSDQLQYGLGSNRAGNIVSAPLDASNNLTSPTVGATLTHNTADATKIFRGAGSLEVNMQFGAAPSSVLVRRAVDYGTGSTALGVWVYAPSSLPQINTVDWWARMYAIEKAPGTDRSNGQKVRLFQGWNWVSGYFPADGAFAGLTLGTTEFGVEIGNDTPAGAGTRSLWIDELTRGVSNTGSINWENLAQIGLNALRAGGWTGIVFVHTFEYGHPDQLSTYHPDGPWIYDNQSPANIRYEFHYYNDPNQEGDYITGERYAEAVRSAAGTY
jgi:hypothetical protein